MTETRPISAPRAGRTFRVIGAVILFLGLAGAGLDYGLKAPATDLSDDVLTASNSKKVQRAIEVNVGKMGVMMDGLSENMQDPATQAGVIAGASILLAAGCFYIAHLQARGAAMDEPPA
jgi:hypothetical protein